MTEFARVVAGVVVETFTPPSGQSLADCFHADIAASFTQVPTGISVVPGWTFDGTNWAAPVAPTLTLAQQARAALMSGLTLTLSGSLTLAATLFPTDDDTTSKIAKIATGLAVNGTFPGGATSYPMKDASGTWHTFTIAQYKQVAGTIEAYVAALDLIIDGNPTGASSLPSSSVSLTLS